MNINSDPNEIKKIMQARMDKIRELVDVIKKEMEDNIRFIISLPGIESNFRMKDGKLIIMNIYDRSLDEMYDRWVNCSIKQVEEEVRKINNNYNDLTNQYNEYIQFNLLNKLINDVKEDF